MNKLNTVIGKSLLTLLACSAFWITPAKSQDDVPQNDQLNMDVTFVGDLELFLKDANKISDNPKIREPLSEIPPIQYKLLPNKLNAPFEVKPINAAKINLEEKLKKLYRGYTRLGFGLYTTPFAELYYTDGRSSKGTYGVHASHISTAGGVAKDDSIPDRMSQNQVRIWGKKFLKKHSLSGGLNWNRDVLHYYGFFPDSFPNADITGLKQRFNTLEFTTGLHSYFRDSSKINYDGNISFYHFSDINDGKESNLDLSGTLRKYMNTELLGLDFGVNYNAFDYFDARDSVKRDKEGTIFRITPTASTRKGNLNVKVGMSLVIDAGAQDPAHFYPIAEADFGLFGNILVPYAGVRGEVQRQTYRDLTDENPFVVSFPNLRNRNKRLELYGGFRGRLGGNASFNARISNTNYEDFAYYINDTIASITNRFLVVYDDLSVLNIGGELSFDAGEKLKFFGRGDYYIYSTDRQTDAWHQPSLRLSAGGVYDLQDKLLLRAEVYHIGKRKALSRGPVDGGELRNDGSYVRELKGFLDMNLEVEYRYTKRLSVYGRLNNFLAQRYAIWNNYNVQRFNAMMGLTFAF